MLPWHDRLGKELQLHDWNYRGRSSPKQKHVGRQHKPLTKALVNSAREQRGRREEEISDECHVPGNTTLCRVGRQRNKKERVVGQEGGLEASRPTSPLSSQAPHTVDKFSSDKIQSNYNSPTERSLPKVEDLQEECGTEGNHPKVACT
jgi:hypothetical protein